MDKAVKHDQDKPRTDLLPPLALLEVAEVFGYGAKKYASYNYMLGMNYSRLIGAALRHLFAFIAGEDTDIETSKSHLAHCVCCILMLMENVRLHKDRDDRYSRFLEVNKIKE